MNAPLTGLSGWIASASVAFISPWTWIGPELAALRKGIGWSMNHWVAAAALVAAILYGSLRLAYSSFYGQLGLRPEDVGFGYSEILAQTVPGLLVMTVAVFAGAAVSVAFVFAYEAILSRVTAFVVVAASKIPGFGYLGLIPRVRSSPSIYSAGIYVLVLTIKPIPDVIIVGAGLLAIVILVELRERNLLALGNTSGLTAGLFLATTFVTGLTLFTVSAYLDGAAVKRGEARHPVVFGLPVASWGGDRAQVTSDAPAAIRTRNGDGLMFLGQAAGTAILYDTAKNESLRVPANSIVIVVKN